jgi:hypothetical protein
LARTSLLAVDFFAEAIVCDDFFAEAIEEV